MAKSPIIVGIVGKKIYLTLILAIILILHTELKRIIPIGNDNLLINNLGGSILNIVSLIIPYIFKFKGNSKTSKIKCTKSIFKDYFILFIIILSILGFNILFIYLNYQVVYINYIWTGLSLKMICYFLLSIIILKIKYYIHHFISIIAFCIFTVINDLIFGSFKNIKSASFLSLPQNIVDDLLCCYIKYLIDKKYHSYWNILFFIGLFHFITYAIIFVIFIIIDPNNNLVFDIIKKGETKYIVLNFFLDAILKEYLRMLFTLIILDYFSLNHVLIPIITSTIISNFITCVSNFNEKKNHLYFLIPVMFQVLSLLFFLEILEFNFGNLNRNTKRNIMLREEEEEMFLKNNNMPGEIEVEVDKDLIIKHPTDKNEFELNEIIDDSEEKDDDNDNI